MRLDIRVSLAAALLVASQTVSAQLVVRPTNAPPGEAAIPCAPANRACVFTDLQGDNTYTLNKDSLKRTLTGQQVYSITVGGRMITLLLGAMNKPRTQIAIASELLSIPTGAMFNPGMLSPDQVHRQYWVSIRNPKTGDEIKAIDVGLFRPDALALSSAGDYVWLTGDELQLRQREVRAYNTRSGKLEHTTPLQAKTQARLYERGFQVGNVYYGAELDAGSATRKHNSPNGYSVAEFTVRRSAGLSPNALSHPVIGIVGFQGGTPELRDMLEGALTIKVAAAGFKVAERTRLKEILQEAKFQNLGLTDSTNAAELGRLVNAQYLLFGQIQTAGTISTILLRLVGVEDGTVKNGIELECRDCGSDDYLQGLTFLMQDWIDAGG